MPERLQAFRFELRPDGAQRCVMERTAGCARFVFNRALALQQRRRADGEKKLGYAALCRELTLWRHDSETDWLAEAPVHPLQQSLRDLERAYTNFFDQRAAFPRFKKKGRSAASFRYPDPTQIALDRENGRIRLPKLGWLRYRASREVEGEVRNVTVSERGGRWFVSILTRREVEMPSPSGTAVGLDLGVKRFLTRSDGTWEAPCPGLDVLQEKLAKAQRRLSRMERFGRNWHKQRKKINRLHRRIIDTRNDYLHKLSHAISQTHAIVFVEDLQVKNMTASAKGTVEAPGRNVRAKSGLNRAILRQGWGEFRRQLEYKLCWTGGELVAVNPRNTSRTCPTSGCGHVARENRPSQARFRCVACGYEGHADHVGAMDVERAGHARLACEVSGEVMPPAAGIRRGDRVGQAA